MLRWIFTVIVVLVAVFFWAITLTVPTYEATAPALISIALSVGVYFLWPKHRKTDSQEKPVV